MQAKLRCEVPELLLVLGMLIAAVVVWPFAPERMPVHWNIFGEVDRYGGKLEGLLALPLIAVGCYVLLLVVPLFDRGRANFSSFRGAYATVRFSILSLLVLVYACILLTAFGRGINVAAILPLAVGLVLMVIGNVMGKIRPNGFVGVRTPWTLSSRRSWNKTHRLARWLLAAMGIAVGLCGLIQTYWMIALTATVFVVSLSWMVIYSYLIWREDPERITPADISPSPGDEELG